MSPSLGEAPRLMLHGTLRVLWPDGRLQGVVRGVSRDQRHRLLAMLAIEAGGVERARLCAYLWPEAPAEAARRNLRQLLFKLKAEPLFLAVPLQTTAQRLAWPVATDVDWLDGPDDAPPQAAWAQDLEAGAATLLEGLDGGEAFDDWLRLQRERIRRRWRLRLLRALDAPALLAPQQARRLIEHALDHEPFDEAIVQRRLRWLARHEGEVAARAAYESWSDRVRDEFGTPARFDPTPWLAARPGPAEGSPGLAPAATSFVGRTAQLRQLDDWLLGPPAGQASVRLVCLWGPPGAGKTRLALHWADHARQRGQPAAIVRLETLDPCLAADGGHSAARGSELALIQALAEACGLPADSPHDPAGQLLAALRDDTRLILLDNFEHRWTDRGFLVQLMAHTRVRCLVTSRTRLGLASEQVLLLPGLPTTDGAGGQAEAQRLFVERAGLSWPPAAPARALVDAICTACHGQPLALELAARQAARLGLQRVRDGLARDAGALADPTPDAPARQHSLEAMFESVLATLPQRLHGALSRLAVLRADFDAALAAALLPDSPQSTLGALVDHCLLALDADGEHFRWHPFMRELALRRAPPEWVRDARRALAGHLHEELRQAALQEDTPDPALLERIARAWPHLAEAWRAVVAESRSDRWVALAAAIAAHAERHALYREGGALLDELAQQLPAPPLDQAEAWARVMLLRARLAHWHDSDASLAAVDQAEPWFARLRVTDGRIGCLRLRGLVLWRRGQPAAAVACQRRALQLCRAPTRVSLRAILLDGLGLSLLSQGRWDAAASAFTEALAINSRLGAQQQVVQNLLNLALDPRPQRAPTLRPFAERALALAREIGYTQYVPHAMTALAWVLPRCGRLAEAEAAATEAAALAAAHGERFVESWALGAAARAALARGQAGESARAMLRAFRVAQQLGETPPLLMHLSGTARWALAQGDAAWACRTAAICLARPELNARVRPEAEQTLAQARRQLGAAAEPLVHDLTDAVWPAAVHEAIGLLGSHAMPAS